MNLTQVLSEISSKGIKLSAEGDELKIRAPKGALTPEIRDLLSKNKLELLQLLQQKNNSVSATSVPLEAVPRDKDLPVSYQQERLWTVEQLMSDRVSLNLCQALRITGLIDIEILQKSWNEIISRYEVLRTNFAFIEGSLVQVVAPSLTAKISVLDYLDLSKTEQERVIQEIFEEESAQSFDLSQGPLFSTKLLRFSEQEGVLVSVFHHIISDGLSVNFLVHEHILLYDSYINNKQSPLKELDIQYGDYAVWQREWLKGDVLEKGLDYWKKQLTDVSTLYPVPPDTFQVSSGFEGIKKNFVIPDNILPTVQKVSNQYNVTPVVIFLSVFYVLILQYSLKDDIIVGLPVSGRVHHKLESAIGFFTETILLRGKIDDNLTFKELLNKVKEITVEAYANV
ncbi:MAG: hypothetical protein F6K22_39290 [Okeania sp. SIO2F4]|uniref:condensation domain-containing protein n=1 Tax=Okeania sp. SIO2F4 TaxID=2607790 RepID=UPI00142B6125|nr:condensation domain-containing protein [Okeania sp. SIO2F4]NES08281.1 hypothetical protein [Okeania sp. SIO2F4]